MSSKRRIRRNKARAKYVMPASTQRAWPCAVPSPLPVARSASCSPTNVHSAAAGTSATPKARGGEMSYPTKEQWAELDRKMSHAYGVAHLMVDGYKLTLQVAKVKDLKYEIVWWVNGEFKGLWLTKDSEEGRRFARPISSAIFKPAKIKEIEKIFGKRRAAKEFPRLHEKRTFYQWSWPTFKPLMRHLMANNKNIAVLNDAEASGS